MSETHQPIRIFCASPSELAPERALVRSVVSRLQRRFSASARIELTLWEDEPLSAHEDYQPQIPSTSEFDVVVGLLWTSLGHELNSRYTSPIAGGPVTGTQFEIESAIVSARSTGRPTVLVYRKKKDSPYDGMRLEEKEAKISNERALSQFFVNLDNHINHESGGSSAKH